MKILRILKEPSVLTGLGLLIASVYFIVMRDSILLKLAFGLVGAGSLLFLFKKLK